MLKNIKPTIKPIFSAIILLSACFLFLAPQISLAAGDVPSLTIPDIKFKPSDSFNFTAAQCSQVGQDTVCSINWIGEYVAAIYKYAIGIVGILATAVMMFGGFLYLTSAGDNSKMSDAKEWIKASVTGLIIALSSYMILYQVNPELVNLKPIKMAIIGKQAEVAVGVDTCSLYKNTDNVIDFSTTVSTPLPNAYESLRPAIKQAFENAASSQNVDIKLLKAIAAQESKFDQNAASGAGACGMMQLLPSTAKFFNSSAADCQWLKDHPEESILIAAKYIASSGRSSDIKAAAAGYNGGYGMIGRDGRIGPFGNSRDCPGAYAYQCCKNPGGLAQTQDYVFKVEAYYNGQ